MPARVINNYFWTILSMVVIIASAAIEFYSKTGVYAGCGYAIAVMLTLYSNNKLNTIIAAVISCLFILFSVFYLHVGEDFYYITVNHMLSLSAVVIAMFFVMYVKNLQEKAEQDNKQVGSLFLNATEGIVLTNRKGEIVLVNPVAENLFGYFKDELVGQRIEILIPDNLRNSHVRSRDGFNAHPVSRPMGAGRDLFGRRKDGSVFPVEISLSHYALGKDSYAIAFIIDITIRKQNEQVLLQQKQELEKNTSEIKQLNAVLEQRVEARTMMLRETLVQLEKSKDELAVAFDKEKQLNDLKSRFVSTVSHEFRTPLSTIMSSASLLAKYVTAEEQDKRDRHILRIKDSVRHMSAMLEDLLSLGRLEEGLVEVKPEFFDIEKFLTEFITEMNEISKSGQNIMLSVKGKTKIVTDKRLLKNILINLISNAIKFSAEDGAVKVYCNNENGLMTISVKDSGMGISEEDQEHLFERFFRARNAANVQGTGLGLHIVSKYLELLGGKISLESKIGEGSIFTINLQSE